MLWPTDIAGIPSDFSSGWRKLLYNGLQNNNFVQVHAGSMNLAKLEGAKFSYGWMTANEMINSINTGDLTTSMKSGDVMYRSIEHLLRKGSSGIYPYMVVYLENKPLGVVDVPESDY